MTITELTNEVAGAELQGIVRQAITENNSVLSGCKVHYLFRGSAVNLETGKHGIRWLIAQILEQAQAVFPVYAGEYRNIYIQYGLTTEDIVSKVRSINGFDKYPDKTISDYLDHEMKGQVGKIRMTKNEDCNRTCKVPRNKWYLIAE